MSFEELAELVEGYLKFPVIQGQARGAFLIKSSDEFNRVRKELIKYGYQENPGDIEILENFVEFYHIDLKVYFNDFHPRNIMKSESGEIYVIDFSTTGPREMDVPDDRLIKMLKNINEKEAPGLYYY